MVGVVLLQRDPVAAEGPAMTKQGLRTRQTRTPKKFGQQKQPKGKTLKQIREKKH
jgi:hypothetical protein